MGRGDRRTRRGKIWKGSYGKTRRPVSLKRIEALKAYQKTKQETEVATTS